MTAAGEFYVEHGHHPDHPAYQGSVPAVAPQSRAHRQARGNKDTSDAETKRKAAPAEARPKRVPMPYSERPIARARRAKALELVERLVTERSVSVRHADEAEMTEWRRVIDYAKRHGLVPAGKRIEKSGVYDNGLHISLVDGVHPNARRQPHDEVPPVPVPEKLRARHPVVVALKEDATQLAMPPQLRHRALLLLQALAAEAIRRGHEVREHGGKKRRRPRGYSYDGRFFPPSHARREGEIDLLVGGFTYTVTIQQEFPQSTDPERSQKLSIELGYHHITRRRQWGDRKRWTLEDVLGLILHEVESRAVDDAKKQVDEERAKADRLVRWQEAMEVAKKQAVQTELAAILLQQAKSWEKSNAVRAYCAALEESLTSSTGDAAAIASAQEWLSWAQRYADAIDPLKSLPTMPSVPTPKLEELKPYLNGWSPYGPESHNYGWR